MGEEDIDLLYVPPAETDGGQHTDGGDELDVVGRLRAEPDLTVTVERTIDAAWAVLTDRQVDAVVAAASVPDGDGLELLAAARATAPAAACVLYDADPAAAVADTAFDDVVVTAVRRDGPESLKRLVETVRTDVSTRSHAPYPTPDDERRRARAARSLAAAASTAELEDITEAVASRLDAQVAFVGLMGEREEEFVAREGFEGRTLPRADSVCTHGMTTDDVFVVPDLQADERFVDTQLPDGTEPRSYAGAPIVDQDGHVVGMLCAMDDGPRSFDEDERAALEALAEETAERLVGEDGTDEAA